MLVSLHPQVHLASDHYILGWSFNKSGPAQSLDVSSLPPLPQVKKRKEKPSLVIITSLIAVALVLITVAGAAAYILRRKKYEEYKKIGKRSMVPTGSAIRISTKQPKVSKTRRFLDKEVLERFIWEYFLRLMYKLR
jgi:hypothetical protein